jgi:hypothetical protein
VNHHPSALLSEARVVESAKITPEVLHKLLGVPRLTLEEVWDDVQKVASTVAAMYTDKTCFALSYDDLYAECLRKVVNVMDTGFLNKPRTEFFKILKTSMNNHVRGIVQRHRFTIKRTGHRPPDRDDVTAVNVKPEISIDDPECGIQIANMTEDCSDAGFDEQVAEDLKPFLTPLEQLVFDQLRSPNDGAFLQAYLDASIGRRRRDELKVKLNHACMAAGLGMNPAEFSALHESIKRKYKDNIMTDKPEDAKYNRSLTILEQVYGVQVPRSTDRVVVARLFTICARDQLEKFSPEIEKNLSSVGAKAPVVDEGSRLSCFGVLYQKNHRICQACGLRAACSTEALNHGLGEITLSPRLLGSRNTRIPTLTDNPQSSMSNNDQPENSTQSETPATPSDAAPASGQREPFTNTERDEVLLNHLKEHYKQIKFGVDVYYTHKDGKNTCVFYVGKEGDKFDLRFCKPNEELKASLVRQVRSFYLPADLSAEDSIKLIEKHAVATFKVQQ